MGTTLVNNVGYATQTFAYIQNSLYPFLASNQKISPNTPLGTIANGGMNLGLPNVISWTYSATVSLTGSTAGHINLQTFTGFNGFASNDPLQNVPSTSNLYVAVIYNLSNVPGQAIYIGGNTFSVLGSEYYGVYPASGVNFPGGIVTIFNPGVGYPITSTTCNLYAQVLNTGSGTSSSSSGMSSSSSSGGSSSSSGGSGTVMFEILLMGN
jgi:uncharacterized membrane protein YgcG